MEKFLIIDDSPEDREIIKSWLTATSAEIEITEVDSIDAGIAMYNAEDFGCVLLDYTFPQGTAQEFLNAVKPALLSRLRSPVVVITGRGNDEIAVTCMKAGAHDYINKDRLTEPGHVAAKIVKRVMTEHQQITEIERSQASEKSALLAALKSQEELERSIAELKKAKLSADAANVSKSAFLANMSHEIRSPLTAILGFTQLLREANIGGEEHREYIQTIERNGEHLLSVINEILDFSKVEAGKVSLSPVEFNLRELVSELVDSFKPAAAKKSILLRAFLHPEFPRIVVSDPTRIRQIVTNLISNAVKFTERGEIVIIGNKEADISGFGRFSIVVSDSGEGINKLDAAKLFKRFAQANESISARYGGTGLGLVLSKKLANMLGGDVELISSEPGVGSLFKLTLPERLFVAETVTTRSAQSLDDVSSLKGKKILVVDDSLDNQLLLRRILSQLSMDVFCLSDGLQAVEQASRFSPDLVLMDVQMPHLDGHEAARLLRSRGFRAPIIGLTAHALPEDLKRSKAAGFNDQLTKPINKNELFRAMLKHLGELIPARS